MTSGSEVMCRKKVDDPLVYLSKTNQDTHILAGTI